jgi:hypothetical protein
LRAFSAKKLHSYKTLLQQRVGWLASSVVLQLLHLHLQLASRQALQVFSEKALHSQSLHQRREAGVLGLSLQLKPIKLQPFSLKTVSPQ